VSKILRISDAASLALHAMGLLATDPSEVLSTRQIAEALGASEAHLAKVMQRLTRAGLVGPVRGPKGGFGMAKNPEEIALLEVYEAIDGPLDSSACLLGRPVCRGDGCILGDLLRKINREVREYFTRTKLSELTGIYGRSRSGA
jgi:Rrf2 family protein